jgi:hypothetical protein
MLIGDIQRAILETLVYSDIFDFPLKFDELHRYLPVRAEADELRAALTLLDGQVGKKNAFYSLAGREGIAEIRNFREARSQKFLPHAIGYGRILGSLPFIRMVALTGSLAVLNISNHADFDYMLVAAKGRVWTARAFALLLNRLVRPFGYTICPNLIVSESALEWRQHDLYSARELVQMIPISGMDMYREVIKVNAWARDFLPNSFDANGTNWANAAKGEKEYSRNSLLRGIRVKSAFEYLLHGDLGDNLEAWEMTRKIARFSKQAGFGEETVFNAEVCQGNFRHHRKWTKRAFETRLSSIASPLPLGEG